MGITRYIDAGLAKLAETAYDALTVKKRTDGTSYIAIRDDIPNELYEWVLDMCRTAHVDGQLPDDWTYEKIHATLECIMNEQDQIDGCGGLEADVYYEEMKAYLSTSHRWGRVDEVLRKGLALGLSDAIQTAQEREIEEIVWAIIDYLSKMLEGDV